jgi:hypothetical protein
LSRNRRRRPFGGDASAAAIGDGFIQRATGDGIQTFIDTIALNSTQLPAFLQYYMMYMKHPWVAACVDLIANSVSGDGYDIIAKKGFDAVDAATDRNVKEIDEFFDIAFVNGDSMRRALFTLAVDLKVFAVGYWRKKRAGSVCVGLERYDPRLIVPKASDDRRSIVGFQVRKGLTGVDGSGNPLPTIASTQTVETIPTEDMIYFTLGGGDQLLGAPSPLEKLDHTLGVDFAIRQFRQAFFKNGATNGKILTSDKANRDQARAVESMIANSKRGVENSFRTWVLLGDWKVDDKGNPAGQADFDFVKGSGINREEICAVYGVPLSKLTYTANSLGQSGKVEDEHTFQEQCVLPLEEAIYEILTRDLLVAEYGIKNLELAPRKRMTIRFDMFGAATQGIQVGMTGNESRELVGLPRIENNPKMEEPMFVGIHTMSVADSEADPNAPDDPTGNGGGSSGELDDTNDDINKKNKKSGGGQPAAKGKGGSWY